MVDKKFNLDFYAKVQTDVDSVKDVVKNLKNQLETLKLPAGATKSFEKSFERLEGQIRDFESLASSGVNSLADTKKVQAAWDKIAKSVNGLSFSLKKLDTISDQIFPKEVSENIKKTNKALEDYQNKLKEIKDTEKYKAKKTQISDAEAEVTRARKKYNTEKDKLANKKTDFTGYKKDWALRAEEYDKQAKKVQELNEEYQNLSNTLTKMRADKTALEAIGAIDSKGGVSSKYKKAVAAKESELADLEDEAKLKEKTQEKQLEFEERIKKAQDRLGKATRNKNQSKSQEKKAKWTKEEAEALAELTAAQKESKDFAASIEVRKEALREEIKVMKEHLALAEQVTQSKINEQSEKASAKKRELDKEEAEESYQSDKKLKKNLDAASSDLKTLEATSQSAKDALEAAEKTVEDLNTDLNNIETDGAKQEWQDVVNTLREFTDVNLDETKGDIEAVKKILEDYTADEIKKTPEILEKLRQAASGAKKPVRDVGKAADDTAEEFREMDRAARDMKNLKDQVLDFFSITNAVQIFKNTIRSAFKTVKELDAAMTETAVVTDFSIDDMWDKLPEYSKEATKLGTSIKSLYEATTLYYQQGLNSAQAMSVGVETMKMARIAGMDAAAATEAMTAALRGFNMEINEISATRINDVYSELAAITAADTSQIATAMGKTASIASSANMEFETTAALLAQIIETTQEAPETAGTAMKTIIARFTEVKELFDEGMLSGKDSEGEEININKIDAALKRVGISLKDFLKGEKGIDDIFLELASKWDSLDLATQRYIATTAAGSRQQSRFLAMMGNYERTMELVDAATTSAGASQKQFDKTLESLDAKLQRLKNAWAEFTMGLADNEIIKFGVDLLTGLITAINGITEALPGATGNIAKLLITIGGLKAGGAIFDSFFKNLAKTGDDAMGPLGALWTSLVDNVDIFKGKISEIGQAIKSMGGLGGTIKTLGSAYFGVGKAAESAMVKQLGLNVAIAGCPIGWIIAGIAALIAIIYGVAKAWEAASDAFKMEKINKAIDQMNQNIEETKSVIDDLGNSRSTLKDLQKEFSNLTSGTQEWKEKLIEVNQQVLSLIEKYPELSQYLTRSSHGTLDIEEAGWDALLEAQNQDLINTSNAKIGMQYAKTDLQEKIDYEKAITEGLGKAFGESIDTASFGANVGTAIGTVIGSVGGGLAAGAPGLVVGGGMGASVGHQLGAQWGYNNQEAIQEAFADTYTWINQAKLDIAGFLDTGWGRAIGHAIAATNPLLALPFDIDSVATAISGDSYEERAQRSMNGGLTQDEFSQFLNALGDAQITFDEETGTFSNRQKALDILTSMGLGDSFEDVEAQARKLGNSFNELIVTSQEYTQAKEGERDALLTNAIVNSNAGGKEYSDAIGNILGESTYKDIEPMLEKEESELRGLTKKELRELYAQKVGGYYENGKLYSDATMQTEWDLGKDTMRKAIASANLAEDMGTSAEKIASALDNLDPKKQELFGEIFSKDGMGIQNETYFDLIKNASADLENGQALDGNWLAKYLGFEDIDTMATSLGLEVDQIGQILSTNLEAAKKRIQEERKATVGAMKKYGKTQQSYEQHAKKLAQMEEKFGPEFNGYLTSLFNSVSLAGDKDVTSAAFDQYMKIAETGDKNDLLEINEVIQNINWSNPIQAVSSLKEQLKSGSEAARNMAKAILEAGDDAFSSGKQMQYFAQSEAFVGIQESIQEVINTQGELSADNILEMADGCSDLKKIMEQTGITASGMAKALTKIQNGEWAVNQLTDAVMAALSSFDSLDSLVAETLKTLSEFDPGVDENEAAEFISQYYEVLNENLEKGAVGNSQNFKILDFMFGENWDKGLEGDELVAQMQYLNEVLKRNSEDMQASWADLAAGKDVYGNAINKAALGSLEVNELPNGAFEFTGFEGMTTDEMVGRIQEAYRVSKEYAAMMVTDFKNYSIDLAKELNANDFETGFENAYKELEYINRVRSHNENLQGASYESAKVIDDSEIRAIADAFDQEYEEVRKRFEEKGALVTNFYDENGFLLQSDEMLAELDRVFTSGSKEIGTKWYAGFVDKVDGKALIDYDGMMAALNQLNIPESAKASITNDIIEAVREGSANGETVYLDYEFSDGSVDKVEIPAGIDVQTAIANAERDLENAKLGEAIANAFGNVEVNVTTNEAGLSQITINVETAVKNANTDIDVKATDGSLQGITDSTEAAATNAKPVASIKADLSLADKAIRDYAVPSKYMKIYVQYEEHAKGIKNSPDTHTALIGEEGPEIHQTKNGAYLASEPQFAQIEKGDSVYTAQETRKILNSSTPQVPRYATGYDPDNGYNKNGTGSKSGNNSEKAENPYDFLYNLLREIQEENRRRERIERRYEKLLDDADVNAQKLIDISREELEQLKENRELEEKRIDAREKQIDQYQKENQDLTKYARTEANEHGEQVLRIDWDAINAVTDPDQMERIETYVSQLEEWYSDMEEAQDTLEDIEDQMEEIRLRGRDEYIDLENKIKDAIVAERQEEIDKLGEINNSINDTNAELIDSIQKAFDKQRRERDNQRTEEDLAEKQRRLLYLQQDTSGANDLEILELQKELDTEYEDYTDTLIDQKISDLQAQNDEAAKAREQQITLMQAQLDKQVQNGENWAEVERLMATGISQTEGLVKGSELEALLKQADGFKGLSETQKMVWMQETNSQIALAATYLNNLQNQIKDLNEEKNRQTAVYEQSVKTPSVSQKSNSSSKGSSNSGNNSKKTGSTGPKHWEATYMNGEKITGASEQAAKQAAQKKIDDWVKKQKDNQKSRWDAGEGGYSKSYLDSRYAQFEKEGEKYKKQISVKAVYKTGGLADFTGPAWLDGTKSRPELVLNQRDTQNFIQLKDILSQIMSHNLPNNVSTENNGEITYDIDINVESMTSDYDVEQMANKVKSMINSDARYRNNNAISLKR